jgi:hypothetical protein
MGPPYLTYVSWSNYYSEMSPKSLVIGRKCYHLEVPKLLAIGRKCYHLEVAVISETNDQNKKSCNLEGGQKFGIAKSKS